MAPCVAMIDEVEKAFAGVNGSGDSGVSSRMFGMFLSWLNDHESDVFVVCTANDVSRLPPEFGRSERFDGIFFLDLPGRVEKDTIWQIYRDQFEHPCLTQGYCCRGSAALLCASACWFRSLSLSLLRRTGEYGRT